MNKKEKERRLKELSNKYFWEQKIIEVICFILIVGLIILAIYISSSIVFMISPEGVACEYQHIGIGYDCATSVFLTGFFGLFCASVIFGMLFAIGWAFRSVFLEWIEDNRNEAGRRAKEELGIKDEEYYW